MSGFSARRGSRPYCPTHDFHGDPQANRTWRVYYCYAADGALLYVGMAEHTRTRMEWHAFYSAGMLTWVPWCVRLDETQPFTCRFDAHAFEVAEIKRLRPAFNKHHNPNPAPWSPSSDLAPLPPYTRRPITTLPAPIAA